MQQILRQATKSDYEGEVLLLAKVAKIMCTEIANFKGFQFDGSFPSDCQQRSVATIISQVSMLLNGVNLKDQESTD